MAEISETYGQPGGPGSVEIHYLRGLHRGYEIDISVGVPGVGGKGGIIQGNTNEDRIAEFPNRGGAGGGRENIPIVEALTAYADSRSESYLKPLIFTDPGDHKITWPYDTDTATLVIVNPGGGGGGGMGETLPGEDGEDGLRGIVFLIPTEVPTQRLVDS